MSNKKETLINKHHENVHKHDFITKKLLEEEYLNNNLSDKEIAKKYNINSKSIVWRYRKKFGIKNKHKNKENKGRAKIFTILIEEAKILRDNHTFKEIAEIMGCSKIVAKRRFAEMGLCKKQNHTEKYKYLETALTSEQRDLIIGSTLGDDTIAKHGAFSFTHSVKQKEYFYTNLMFYLLFILTNNQKYLHIKKKILWGTIINLYIYALVVTKNVYQ